MCVCEVMLAVLKVVFSRSFWSFGKSKVCIRVCSLFIFGYWKAIIKGGQGTKITSGVREVNKKERHKAQAKVRVCRLQRHRYNKPRDQGGLLARMLLSIVDRRHT